MVSHNVLQKENTLFWMRFFRLHIKDGQSFHPTTFVIAFMLRINYIMDAQMHFYNKHAHWVVMFSSDILKTQSGGTAMSMLVPLFQMVGQHGNFDKSVLTPASF